MKDTAIKAGTYCPVCRGIGGSDCWHDAEEFRVQRTDFKSLNTIATITKQRDLAVEALKSCGVNDGLNGPTQYFDEDLVERAIKESEGE